MGVHVVTGSASGMGAATARVLREADHTVIGIDLRDADITADLGTDEGRATAVAGVLDRCGGCLDGVAAVAGVGPSMKDAGAVVAINYFNPVRLLEGLRPALADSGAGRVVVVGSNSAGTVPVIDDALVGLLLAGDEETHPHPGQGDAGEGAGADDGLLSRHLRLRDLEVRPGPAGPGRPPSPPSGHARASCSMSSRPARSSPR